MDVGNGDELPVSIDVFGCNQGCEWRGNSWNRSSFANDIAAEAKGLTLKCGVCGGGGRSHCLSDIGIGSVVSRRRRLRSARILDRCWVRGYLLLETREILTRKVRGGGDEYHPHGERVELGK
jgi:hypothetical protein